MRRVTLSISLLLVALVAGTGCGRKIQYRQDTLEYLDNTYSERLSFVFTQDVDGRKVLVKGRVEDGFRYQAIVNEEGRDVIEALVDDDSIALRVIDPAGIPELQAPVSPLSTIVTDALKGGQWVIDPAGAPPVQRPRETLQDPLRNAIGVAAYVKAALAEARDVRLWRADDIEPAYRPFEDHFPKPDEKQGVRRYDLVRVPIPKPTGQAGGLDALPKTSMFRKMAIYVKGQKVTQVYEEVDIDGHPDFVDARKKNKTKMLELLRGIKSGAGEEKIVPRRMTIIFRNLGNPEIEVRQPAGALTASLKGFFGIGVEATAPIPAAPEGGSSGSTETSTPSPAA